MTTATPCPPHYWLFGNPLEGITHGVCKHCGAESERSLEVPPTYLAARGRLAWQAGHTAKKTIT
jgi:hypothetical protein